MGHLALPKPRCSIRPRCGIGQETTQFENSVLRSAAQVLFDLRPNEAYAQEHIERNPGSVGVQAGRDISEHEANTTAVVYATTGMAHTEGGWPKEVDVTEAASVIRFRKKASRAENFLAHSELHEEVLPEKEEICPLRRA